MIIERPSSRSWLPVGATLPAATWDGRHRNLVVLLWGLLGAVVVVLWLVERSSSPRVIALQVLVGALLVSALVATAEHPRLSPPAERSLRSCAVAFGLMVSAAVVVGVLHGASEAHFLFFVLVPLLALYEAWLPSLVAVVVVVLQHGLVGALVPGLVFSGEQHVASDPWLLAATHGVLFAAACAGSLIPWQGAERAREQVAGVVEQLRVQTRSDELTGLANRTGLARGLDLVLCRAADSGPFTPAAWAEDTSPDRQGTSMPVAVVVMDLNRFKEVNDTLGHSAGDQLLRDTAARMSSVVAGVGLLARLGGDEFALVLPGADGQAGIAIAELLRQQLRGGSRVAGIDLDLDLSAGVAVHAGGEALDAADRARVAEELLRHADIAMYVAKAAGGGALEYDPALDHHSTARLEIARDLRIAVERDDELLLHFQPKLSAADGRLVGVEALVRWQHPVRGFLPPGDFVPVLENTDLVNAFTDRVLQLGLDQARAWLDAGYEVPVAVNVSPRCMVRPGFVDAVAQMLASRSLPTHLLRVEITEDALVADPEVAATVITELRAMGVPTSIDDFGTGYSSLSYLRRLPVDEVKLDRAFVTGLGQPLQDGQQLPGAGDEVLVASIIDLAHRLGMKVVAEGVEHDDELAVLRSLGCDVTQGYLHSRPLPASLLPSALLETSALRGSGARTAAPVTAPS